MTQLFVCLFWELCKACASVTVLDYINAAVYVTVCLVVRVLQLKRRGIHRYHSVSEHAFEAILMNFSLPCFCFCCGGLQVWYSVPFACWGAIYLRGVGRRRESRHRSLSVVLNYFVVWDESCPFEGCLSLVFSGLICLANSGAMFSSFLLIMTQFLISVFMSHELPKCFGLLPLSE